MICIDGKRFERVEVIFMLLLRFTYCEDRTRTSPDKTKLFYLCLNALLDMCTMLEGLAMGSTLADQQLTITPLGGHKTTTPKPSTTGVYPIQSTSDGIQSEDKPMA